MGQNRESRILKQIVVLILSILVIAAMTLPALGIASAAAENALQAAADDTTEPEVLPSPSLPNAGDGSTIDSVVLSWITPDSETLADNQTPSGAKQEDSHLFRAAQNTSAMSMMYKITVSLSGEHDYAPGDITITIPAQVWHARKYDANGVGMVDPDKMIGTLELPFPEEPSTKAHFNWQIIDGNYVITNTRTVGAVSSFAIDATITGLRPIDVVDMSKCEPITVRCEVTTNKGNTIWMDSNSLTAQIDTQAKINGMYLKGDVYESRPSELSDEMLEKLPEDPTEYVYVRWYTYHSHTNNQPYSLDIQATLPKAYEYVTENGQTTKRELTDGIFLGSTNYSGTCPQTNTFEANIGNQMTNTSTDWQYGQTVYMWSAYLKEKLPESSAKETQRVYYLTNEVKWTLTESDAAVEGDERKETVVEDTKFVTYSPVKWYRPASVFGVDKWTKLARWDYKDYTYGYALSQLDNGDDVDMDFVLRTGGYGYALTSEETADIPYAQLQQAAISGDLEGLELDMTKFGQLGWKQVTYERETFFNYDETPLTASDFEFKSLRISTPSKMRYAKSTSGSWGYLYDSTLPTPDLLIEYQLNGVDTWLPAAEATWGTDGTGALNIEILGDNVSASGMTINFPDNTTNIRHTYVSNVFGGETVETCELAAIEWYVYPTITLKASDRVRGIVAELFAQSDTPSTKFENNMGMDATGWVGREEGEKQVVTNDFDYSMATLKGASYGVSLNAEYTAENDTQGGERAILHYTVTLSEQSDLTERSDYDDAVAAGAIPAETSGVWYSLLPPKVVPLTNTVALRSGDTITDVYTIENFRDTGRTMLVVEAELTPRPVYNNLRGWGDKPQLTFDAVYSWLDLKTYGNTPVSYAAFESTTEELRRNTLGTITYQKGEPDNPARGFNATTPSMPADILAAMTNLDPKTDENRFVYGTDGGTDSNGDPINVGVYELYGFSKAVKNDVAGVWTQGLREYEQATVYEGQSYTYRMVVSSDQGKLSSGIVMYDALESYVVPAEGVDLGDDKKQDHAHTRERMEWEGKWEEKGQWRGTLEQVDLSELVKKGVAPRLLYSTTLTDAHFDESGAENAAGAYDISNGDIWQEAELDENGRWSPSAGMDVTAVAVDATKAADGSAFELQQGEWLAAYLKMRAPDGESAASAYARTKNADGSYNNGLDAIDWDAAMNAENNMYAYNSARVRFTERDDSDSDEPAAGSSVVRKHEYTRVGIVPLCITVEKVWQDQNDHDNIRPDEVTIHVLRRPAEVGSENKPVTDANGQPLTATLNADNEWKAVFKQLEFMSEDGVRWLYTFEETPVEGYECRVQFVDFDSYIMTNVHPNDQVTIAGVKEWDDNNDELKLRPESIILKLYRDEELIATQTVRPNSSGVWSYSFGDVDKNAFGGKPYVYRIEEEYVPKYEAKFDGYTKVTNAYAPYGDLEVSKIVTNSTEALKDARYTFKLVLLAEAAPGEEAGPLDGEYDCEIHESSLVEGEVKWTKVEDSEDTIKTGETFELQAGQKLLVKNLPSESRYQVIETELEGFTDESTDAEGTIRAARTAQALINNVYTSSGTLELSLTKTLTGRAIRKNQFTFELVDMTEKSETYGEVIRTAKVDAPHTTNGGNGVEIKSTATARFGQVSYTQADDGKIFKYEVREVNDNKPGYKPDNRKYTVTVKVTDDGDGTMTVVPTITDAENKPVDEMTFVNQYTATGTLTLKALKTLTGRALKDKEFTFKLYEYNDSLDNPGEWVATATNDADGNVVFELNHFNQNSVSLDDNDPAIYKYLLLEDPGAEDDQDAHVIYDPQRYIVEVRVYDNGDGTLRFAQGQQVATRVMVECTECEGKGATGYGMPDVLNKTGLGFAGSKTSVYATTYGEIMPAGGHYFIRFDLCSVCYGLGSVQDSPCETCRGTGIPIGGVRKYENNVEYEIESYEQNKNDQLWYAKTKGSTSYLRTFPNVLKQYMSPAEICGTCSGTGKVPGPLTVTGEAETSVFANQLKPGHLSVSKVVPEDEGSGNDEQEFPFHVKLTGELATEYWYEKGSTVNTLTVTDGTLSFSLKKGEMITIKNLPASTGYQVWEDTPAGWTLKSATNANGVIAPTDTIAAVFTNEYTPDQTSVTLRATKLMDGEPAGDQAFQFTLSEGGTVLETVKNTVGGAVVFDRTYTAAGTHTYTIAEVDGGVSTIDYDETKYTVTVKVTDKGNGVLSAAVT